MSEDGMENWKEYHKGEIPKGKYKAKFVFGEAGLVIELASRDNRIVLDFGIVSAIRTFDRNILDADIYDNIEELRKDKFSNVIYEVENGNYLNEMKWIASGYLDYQDMKQYTIITDNCCIDIAYEWELKIEVL